MTIVTQVGSNLKHAEFIKYFLVCKILFIKFIQKLYCKVAVVKPCDCLFNYFIF